MVHEAHAKFKNDVGVPEIRIGVKEFKCAGATPPQDHPHIFLKMIEADSIVCPYCSTLFHYDAGLGPGDTEPPGCLFLETYDG